MIPFREIVSSHLRILRLPKLSRGAIKRQQYLSIMTLLDHSAQFLRHMRSYFGICYRHSLKPIIESTSLQTHINLLPSRAEKEKNEDVATKSLWSLQNPRYQGISRVSWKMAKTNHDWLIYFVNLLKKTANVLAIYWNVLRSSSPKKTSHRGYPKIQRLTLILNYRQTRKKPILR